jgi:hypothetical protein
MENLTDEHLVRQYAESGEWRLFDAPKPVPNDIKTTE